MSLTKRDLELIVLGFQCYDHQPKVNYHKLAELAGFKNGSSASVCYNNAKKKLLSNAPSTANGSIESVLNGSGPASTPAARKRKAPAKATTNKPAKRNAGKAATRAGKTQPAAASAHDDEEDDEEDENMYARNDESEEDVDGLRGDVVAAMIKKENEDAEAEAEAEAAAVAYQLLVESSNKNKNKAAARRSASVASKSVKEDANPLRNGSKAAATTRGHTNGSDVCFLSGTVDLSEDVDRSHTVTPAAVPATYLGSHVPYDGDEIVEV